MRAHVVCRGVSSTNHQHMWGGAFAAGLRRHGWDVTIGSTPAPCDLLVVWSVNQRDAIRRQLADGGEVCVLERGYVGDRFKWTSVSFGGGLNGRGRFYGPFEDGSRWQAHFAHLMRPWRAEGSRELAVIMGQIPADNAVRDIDINAWCRNAAERFQALGFRTMIRAHPMVKKTVPLVDVLDVAAVAVTWNSNSGVDAVLAGVPTVAMDRGSMAWDVSGHELRMPPAPDRTAWAYATAWKQWTVDEMKSGQCWEAVGSGAFADTADARQSLAHASG